MASVYHERAQAALEVLRAAGARPVTFRELRAAGVANPAQTIYKLELAGHLIEHSGLAVRLVAESDTPRPGRPRRPRRA